MSKQGAVGHSLFAAAIICLWSCGRPADNVHRSLESVDARLSLGKAFQAEMVDSILAGPNWLFLRNSSQLDFGYEILVNDIHLGVGLEDTVSRHITFVQVTDSTAYTPEGIRPGTQYSVAKDFAVGELYCEPGWAYYIELLSGWQAAFCLGSSCTDFPPEDSTPVSFFFKR